MVAAPSDQSTGIQWYNGSYIKTDATDTGIGTGNLNTNKIIFSQGAESYAAQLCADLVLNGYNDWYLPSKDELNLLYSKKNFVGGFTSNDFWSSSENSNSGAWSLGFSDGGQFNHDKGGTSYVRAIRSFDMPASFIQQQLNSGKTVKELLTAGVKVDSLYGKIYQGGLVFYVDTTNGSGMVTAPSDQDDSTLWYNGSYIATNATAIGIGTGNANTNKIVANQGVGSYAAKLCYDLVINSYTDWFLPSKDELNLMYVNLHKKYYESFACYPYWSSSEESGTIAMNQNFSNGYQNGNGKDDAYHIRAVRSFDMPIAIGVTDIDGNIYDTIRIGTQVWFKQNLKTAKYNDGTAIPNVTNNSEWAALTTPAYCAYNNTKNADTINTYGLLYNWYTVNTNKLCPSNYRE